MSEKRHFQRIFYQAEAKLSDGSTQLACKIIDISLQGCLLEIDQPWQSNPEALYSLSLKLSPDAGIEMALRYSHGSGQQFGFKCETIDIDSITNLRRLVELNLGDSSLLDRELHALSHTAENPD